MSVLPASSFETSLRDEDFAYISELVRREVGIHLPPAKRMFVAGRLFRRMRQLGLETATDYCRYLRRAGTAEHAPLFEVLCTHETRFFREAEHFAVLERRVPLWLARARERASPGSIRILSAGCSTGEEVYSIAMTLQAGLGHGRLTLGSVVGMDISRCVLDVARDAIYPVSRSAELPQHYLKRFMLRGSGPREGQMRVGPTIRQMVDFRLGNLCQLSRSVDGRFDAIFCRNVLIYFDAETRTRTLRSLLELLTPGGLLFVGHAEGGPAAGIEARVAGPGILEPLPRSMQRTA